MSQEGSEIRAEEKIGCPRLRQLDGEGRHVVARHGGRVESAVYDDPRRSVLEAVVPRAACARLEDDLKTLAHGSAKVEEVDPHD